MPSGFSTKSLPLVLEKRLLSTAVLVDFFDELVALTPVVTTTLFAVSIWSVFVSNLALDTSNLSKETPF